MAINLSFNASCSLSLCCCFIYGSAVVKFSSLFHFSPSSDDNIELLVNSFNEDCFAIMDQVTTKSSHHSTHLG